MAVHHIQSGETLWSFTKNQLQKRGFEASNAEIVRYMTKIAGEHNLSVDDFAKKTFFAGKDFEYSESIFGDKKEEAVPATQEARANIPDTISQDTSVICDALRVDSSSLVKKVPVQQNDSTLGDVFVYMNQKQWSSTKSIQDTINSLPTDKQRVIEYHKQMDKSRENYLIVDKKNYTATVYTWDGNVVDEYEIGVAKQKTDALLRRSKKNPAKDFKSTTAGIYTANYRASGRDAYRRLYNDRVLTLSNDGLRQKGVGNGETGVALHQVPNGNTYRRELLNREGASEANNRFSSGCVNFLPEDFDECMSHIKGVGTKVYILPEDENNYMYVKNEKLHFAQKDYTGDVATTTTSQDPIKNLKIKATNEEEMRQEGLEMARTLSSKKPELTKVLGLDNDTYNELARLVLGIAGQETHYGDPLAGLSIKNMNGGYWLKEHARWLVNTVKNMKGNTSYDSRGITQCKLESYTDPETIKLLNQYKITNENLAEPEKATLATMIILSCIYKNELPSIKEKVRDCGLTDMEAVLYCYQGRKWRIKNGTARPTYEYIQSVNNYAKDFKFIEYDAA